MELIKLPGMNRELGAPRDWDEAKHGPCDLLPVFAEVKEGSMYLTSAWKPDDVELDALVRGQAVALTIVGAVHPPIVVGVFQPPDEEPDAKRERLEGAVWRAVNELAAHMGSSAFKLPGRINPAVSVYVGMPDEVWDLASGQAQKGARDGSLPTG